MAVNFGWAYVSGSTVLGPFSGADKSLQFKTGESQLSGNADLTFDPSTKHVKLTGSITVDASAQSSKVALYVKNDGRSSGILGMDGNKRLIDYDETFPSNCVGEVYGPITIANGNTLTIEANSHMVIKIWPY
jgi:hypothetical protein